MGIKIGYILSILKVGVNFINFVGGDQRWGGVGSSSSASSLELPAHPKAPQKGLPQFRREKSFILAEVLLKKNRQPKIWQIKQDFFNAISWGTWFLSSMFRTCYVCFNCKNFEQSQAKECEEGEDFCFVSFLLFSDIFQYLATVSFLTSETKRAFETSMRVSEWVQDCLQTPDMYSGRRPLTSCGPTCSRCPGAEGLVSS